MLSAYKRRYDTVNFDTTCCTVASCSVSENAEVPYSARIHTIEVLKAYIIGYRLHNSFEIVASAKFPGVGHALKQRASMQVTRGDRFSNLLCQHYLLFK